MQTPQKSQSLRPFKQRKSLATRQEEVAGIRAKFPNKIPVVVERYSKEKFLPLLDKTKFLVPQELTMTQFLGIIRSRMVLGATEAFYLLVNNKSAVSMSVTMAEVYRDYRDEDGFLYVTYASQEMFGGGQPAGRRGPGAGPRSGARGPQGAPAASRGRRRTDPEPGLPAAGAPTWPEVPVAPPLSVRMRRSPWDPAEAPGSSAPKDPLLGEGRSQARGFGRRLGLQGRGPQAPECVSPAWPERPGPRHREPEPGGSLFHSVTSQPKLSA